MSRLVVTGLLCVDFGRGLSAQATPEKTQPTQQPQSQVISSMRLWIGLAWLQMTEFNDLLASQQNNPIRQEIEVAGEADAVTVPVPSLKTMSVQIPIGVEFVGAGSETSHTANGASATVNWTLPVFGIYTSPRLSYRSKKKLTINLRPIGIGYYSLGRGPISAELTITDRPGSLQARSTTWGYLGMAGLEYHLPTKGVSILVEAGYRRLMFHDVSLTPKNGFTTGPGGGPAQQTSLASRLDYSGGRIRVGIALGL